MSSRLRWDVEGCDWPHREASEFIKAGGLEWHVQRMGEGPPLLLLHGTGASTHSWRGMMPLLAEHFAVLACDLPGHGFTKGRLSGGPTLKAVARAVAGLLAEMAVAPVVLAGHSAGTAIALQMARDGQHQAPVIGFNAALMPFPGLAAQLFPALAKVLFVNPFVPHIFARMARVSGETGRFIRRATASQIEPEGVRCYETLMRNPGHCRGALDMMASWNLAALERELPHVPVPVKLVHSSKDAAVPLSSVEAACKLLPDCEFDVLPGLGHLAHEERPELATGHLLQFSAKHGIIPATPKAGEDAA